MGIKSSKKSKQKDSWWQCFILTKPAQQVLEFAIVFFYVETHSHAA